MKTNPMYPRARELYQNQLKKLEACWALEANKKHIRGFLTKCQGSGISTLRLSFYCNRLRQIAELMGNVDFKKAGTKEIEGAMASLEGRGYKAHTMDAFIVSLKAFYRWLYGLDRTEALPKCVRWVERKRPPNRLKKENLLTEEEVNRMIKITDDPMKKAMLAVLYEGALRPEELRGIKVGDVHLNNRLVKVYVRGKMANQQGDRTVFLARSYNLVKNWLECHPNRDDPGAWLWPVSNKPIQSHALINTVKKLAQRANVDKNTPINPYLFRHSMGTYLYKNLGSVFARKMMGHIAGSRMERVYVHLADEDVEGAIEKMYNIKKGANVKKGVCVRCGDILQFGGHCCSKCGLVESTAAALEASIEEETTDQIMDILLEDSAIRGRIVEMREEIRRKLGLPSKGD